MRLLGDGPSSGSASPTPCSRSPDGLAQAFIIGRDFVGRDRVALVLGDNIFYGHGLSDTPAARPRARTTGATVFGYRVRDPERYGVVEFDADGRAVEPRGEAGEARGRPTPSRACTSTTTTVIDIAAEPEALAARRAGDHRRQPRVPRRGAAPRRAARPRHRLARHRHARVAAAGLEVRRRRSRSARG